MAILSTLSSDVQLAAMKRVFERLALAFGNQFVAKWNGQDLVKVYRAWAERLGGFEMDAIGFAVSGACDMLNPPNLGQFVDLCRAYKQPSAAPSVNLIHRRTREEINANLVRIEAIRVMLAKNTSVNDICLPYEQ